MGLSQSGNEATYLAAWELGVVGFFIRPSGLTDALQWMVTNVRTKKNRLQTLATTTLMKISRTDRVSLCVAMDTNTPDYDNILCGQFVAHS